MPAMEILSGRVVAPDTTLTALTMSDGNSLTIRDAPDGSEILLLQAWVDAQGAGDLKIRSPLMHDNTENIRIGTIASEVRPLLPWGFPQKLFPQDTLVVLLSGSATAGDIENAHLLIYYSDLAGVDAVLESPDTIRGRTVNLLTVENTLSLGTGGGYTGEEALNAEYDLLQADTKYALLGYRVDAECGCIRWRSNEIGSVGVGGPGNETQPEITCNWFVMLSEVYGLPLIPVFSSANKTSILLDGQQDENGTDVTVQSFLAELAR